MVDYYGRWKAEKDYKEYPENKWCDYDYIAAWILESGYKPKTTIKNLTEMILAHYEMHLMDEDIKFYTDITESENNPMISVVDVACYVSDSGGLREFDYYC